jgi:hypothetical protein
MLVLELPSGMSNHFQPDPRTTQQFRIVEIYHFQWVAPTSMED